MRPLLHVVSLGLLLPSLLLAAAFALLGHVIGGVTLLGVLDRLLADALWLLTWGIYAFAAFLLAILVGGLFVRTRWLAACVVALLSAGSAITLLVVDSSPLSFGQSLFLLPGAASLGISGWLAYVEWPT